jgi:tetratricopeptide (TPR) repeat protein
VRQLARAFPDSAPVQVQVGMLEAMKSNPTAARTAFERALAADADNLQAITGLVAVDLAEQRPDEAVARVERRLARTPADPQVTMLMARTYAAAGQLPKVEETLKRAIAADSSNLAAYAMLASFYVRQQRLDEAAREYDELSKRDPRGVGAHTMVATILDMQKRHDEARQRYEQILAIDPNAPVAANNLAWLYAERGGNLDIALQLAQTASRALPDNPAVNDTLGWIYYKRDLASLAVPPLEKSVEVAPENPTFHFHLGLAYAKIGDVEKARTALEQALKLNPQFDGAEEAQQVLSQLQG